MVRNSVDSQHHHRNVNVCNAATRCANGGGGMNCNPQQQHRSAQYLQKHQQHHGGVEIQHSTINTTNATNSKEFARRDDDSYETTNVDRLIEPASSTALTILQLLVIPSPLPSQVEVLQMLQINRRSILLELIKS